MARRNIATGELWEGWDEVVAEEGVEEGADDDRAGSGW
jgi:hypothetical protein